jgi:hypothetical protein
MTVERHGVRYLPEATRIEVNLLFKTRQTPRMWPYVAYLWFFRKSKLRGYRLKWRGMRLAGSLCAAAAGGRLIFDLMAMSGM